MARPSRLVLLFFVTTSAMARADAFSAYWNNLMGVKQFQSKSYFRAYQDFLKALEVDPLNSGLQMNLGLTFLLNEEFDKAEKAFDEIFEKNPSLSSALQSMVEREGHRDFLDRLRYMNNK